MAKSKQTKQKRTKEMGRYYHKKTEVDGIVFDSQTEAEFYQYLKEEQQQGRVLSFEMQKTFVLQDKFIIVDGKKIEGADENFKKIQKENPGRTIKAINYIADFVVVYSDGTVRVIDVKGAKTPDFKLKEKMFNYKYPEYNELLCIVKYKKQWMDYDEQERIKRENRKLKKLKSKK